MATKVRLIGLVTAGVVLTLAIGVGVLYLIFAPKTTDRTGDWKHFYELSFSLHFWIPPEATVILATRTQHAFMGSTERVVFTLPSDKTPEAWLALIAEKSGVKEFKQSSTLYDASHLVNGEPNRHQGTPTDQYFVRYWPEDRRYEAVWGWD